MKLQYTANRTGAFTRNELVVVIGVVALLAILLLATLKHMLHEAQRISCVNNLKEIGIAFETWKGEHGGKYPMQVALTNSEAMKLLGSGNAYVLWRSIGCFWPTNWLSTNWQASIESDWDSLTNHVLFQQSLYCPADADRTYATNFIDFNDANISYFFNLDAAESHPQMILDGDDNLTVDGVRVKPGILNLSTSNSLGWTKERHQGGGNIGMADGSVQQVASEGLNSAAVSSTSSIPTNNATNRWVIP